MSPSAMWPMMGNTYSPNTLCNVFMLVFTRFLVAFPSQKTSCTSFYCCNNYSLMVEQLPFIKKVLKARSCSSSISSSNSLYSAIAALESMIEEWESYWIRIFKWVKDKSFNFRAHPRADLYFEKSATSLNSNLSSNPIETRSPAVECPIMRLSLINSQTWFLISFQ